jgi:hypothetical protein
LLLHLGHGKRWAASFKDSHMTHKEFSGVTVNVGIWASDCDLAS